MSVLRAVGEAIGKQAAYDAVRGMVASGEMDRIVEDATVKKVTEMANDPRYVLIKDQLIAGAAKIQKKREDAERRAREARIAEYRSLPWWMRLFVDKP